MNTIVTAGKGGGGKSTTTVNLAVIARGEGHRVGIVEGDPQGSVSEWRHARGTADIPLRACRPDQLEEALRSARRAGLDWLFIDMPPDVGKHTLFAFRAADLVLLPMRPTRFDIGVTRQRIELLRSVGRPFAVLINAAPPRRQGVDSPMARDARDALRSIGAPLWRGQITHRNAIPNALIGGQGVAETETFGPAAAEYRALWNAVVHNVSTQRISA
jgi:chromosome partitioning protein